VELDDPSGHCVALQAAVAGALTAAGLYEPERRPWLPHVTIARARGRSGVGRGAAAAVPEVPVLEFAPPSVSVYRSQPGPGGSRYEALARYELG
jgi:2'-5' RNA ligase